VPAEGAPEPARRRGQTRPEPRPGQQGTGQQGAGGN